jgi:uncharacterized protein (TIGR02466 family)
MELKFDSRTDIIQAFATPVYMFRIDGAEPLNTALAEAILKKEREDPGLRRSNVGGWHSSDDFFAWPDHGVDTLRQAVAGVVQTVVPLMVGGDCEFEVRLASWANVLRYGGYNKRHSHPDCQLSLVYYVRVGTPPDDEAPESGVFELLDPRVHAEMATLTGDPVGRSLLIRPFDGQMSVFPSWMYHQVNPYYGEGERISVAINAHIGNLRRKD